MHCASCKKNTGKKNSIVRRTKQNQLMFVSNCGKEKLRFIKSQEVSRLELLLSSNQQLFCFNKI